MEPPKETKHYANWLREEHQRAEELMLSLRDMVTTVPQGGGERWFTGVREKFDHLRAHLQKHMALEERGGYLATVLEVRPTLSDKVDRLRSEHRELMRVINDIHTTMHDITPTDSLLIKDCCARIERLLSYIQHHEAAENLIVLSVFTDDLGSKD